MSLRDELIVYFWGKRVSNECGQFADAILECPAIKEIIESLEKLVEATEPIENAMKPPAVGLYDLHLQVFYNIINNAQEARRVLEAEHTNLPDVKKYPYRGNTPHEPQTTIEQDLMNALLE